MKKLKSQFTAIILLALFILLFLQSAIIIYNLLYNQKRSESYFKGIVDEINSTISARAQNIDKMSYAITTNNSLANLYRSQQATGHSSELEDVYQMASFMCQYNRDVLDIIIVNLSGNGMSYYSGYNADDRIVEDLKGQYSFGDVTNTERKFVFFPPKDYPDASYFVYIAPVQNSSKENMSYKKIATAIFVCSMDAINNALDFQINDPVTKFSVYDSRNNLISSNKDVQDTKREDSGKSVAVNSRIQEMGLTVTASISTEISDKNANFLVNYYIISTLTIVSMLVCILLVVKHRVSRPVSKLLDEMDSIGKTNLRQRLTPSNIFEVNLIISKTNQMLCKIENITHKIFETQNKLYESEIRNREAELYALQSQINPHFFCNTMQCIRGIALLKNDQETAAISLAMTDLFRYTISTGEVVKVSEEIQIIEEYISIFKIRYADKFTYQIDVEPDILDLKTIKLILQPLVENAMLHGISHLEENGRLIINGKRDGDTVMFSIIDNGPGIDEESLNAINQSLASCDFTHFGRDKHLGLCNINRRIKLKFGEEYGLKIYSNPNGTEVQIRFSILE